DLGPGGGEGAGQVVEDRRPHAVTLERGPGCRAVDLHHRDDVGVRMVAEQREPPGRDGARSDDTDPKAAHVRCPRTSRSATATTPTARRPASARRAPTAPRWPGCAGSPPGGRRDTSRGRG